MTAIHVITTDLSRLQTHWQRGKWHWHRRGGVVFARCDPRQIGARQAVASDPGVGVVLPAATNPAALPAALVTALAAHGATATDTARTLLSKLHASGVTIFDPDI